MELGFSMLLVLVAPFIIIWPVLIWAGTIKNLYSLICDRRRQRAKVQQNQAINTD